MTPTNGLCLSLNESNATNATLDWGYVIAVSLSDYYDGELWKRIFPPQPDTGDDTDGD